MIPVTKPFLPPIEEYKAYVDGIWQRQWLTNNGPLVDEFESSLRNYLKLPHLLFMSNGTIALQIAIKALELKGRIITTPFSYVATTSSILWEGCEPVFVDIDPFTLNLDPSKIEAAITSDTSAILATHVFGNPCNIQELQAIARRNNLKVIYDAAHAFGTLYKGKSVLGYGDVSTVSFHATKLFHTTEGGAVAAPEPGLIEKMAWLRNFGHHGPGEFMAVGINGKNSELHAAMGLLNLKYLEEILDRRRDLAARYDERLRGLRIRRQSIDSQSSYNYAYYPVIFESEDIMLKSLGRLNENDIYPRRYFWPSLNTISYVRGRYSAPVSEDISLRILCLPMYHSLAFSEIDRIAEILLQAQSHLRMV